MLRLALLLILSACVGLAGQIEDVVRSVGQSNYTNYLLNLLYARNGESRGINGAQHDAARDNIKQTFERFGLTTTLHPFQYQDGTYYNVVGVLPGKVRPNEFHVIGAHYDSIASRTLGATSAPGADDNATGVAAVLEAARVLSMQELETSVVFIAFDREEQGLYGSRAWATDHAADRVHSMISVDMIGYNPEGGMHNIVAVCGPASAPGLAASTTPPALASAVAAHSGGITPHTGCNAGNSDHESFKRISQSALLSEPSVSTNPNYHRVTDSVDTPNYLDFVYATRITRAAVGYLATYAGVLTQPEGTARLSSAGIANAASWVYGPAAPAQLLSLIGAGLTVDGAAATAVSVRDAAGVERPATLTYTSAGQINLALPDGLAPGAATITVARGDGTRVSAPVRVETIAPGFFAADASGTGAAAAQAVRVAPDGTQTMQNLFACSAVCSSVPVDFGAENDRVVLVFYATGLRGRRELSSVTATIGSRTLPVEYAGPQFVFPGLDQVNVALPRDMRGQGEVAVSFDVEGKRSNPITINLGSTI